MMTKTDRTVAKIGRSTKKCETFIEFARSDVRTARRSMPSRRLDLSRLRGDLAAEARAHEPVDDDPIARFEAGADVRPSSVMGPGRTTFGSTVPSSFTVITTLRD